MIALLFAVWTGHAAPSPWGQVAVWTARHPTDRPDARPPDFTEFPSQELRMELRIRGTSTGEPTAWLHVHPWVLAEARWACDQPGVRLRIAYAPSPWSPKATAPQDVTSTVAPLAAPASPWSASRLDLGSEVDATCQVVLTPVYDVLR